MESKVVKHTEQRVECGCQRFKKKKEDGNRKQDYSVEMNGTVDVFVSHWYKEKT